MKRQPRTGSSRPASALRCTADLYVFPGDHSTVLVMDVNSTITGPDVQAGFHPEARYEFKVHFDGTDFETLTYRVSFSERDVNGRQALQVRALIGDDACSRSSSTRPSPPASHQRYPSVSGPRASRM
jgi:hypothetical protein